MPLLWSMELLGAEFAQQLGVGFVDGQQVVAGGAVVGDGLCVFGRVVSVMAAEATRRVIMADVVWVSTPRDLHLRGDVLRIYGGEGCSGLFDLAVLAAPVCGVLRAIEGFERRFDLGGGFGL